MESWAAAVAVAAVLVVAFLVGRRIAGDRFTIEQTSPHVSGVDGARYRVHGSHADAPRAADTLALLNARVVALMRHLRGRYILGADGDRHPARREAVVRLLGRYNPDNLAENSPRDPSGDTSYTVDKGAIVAICLRARDPRAGIHDIGTLTFVTFHEMAHIAVKEVDHPPRFWSAFRFLLEEGEAAGVYRSPRFEQQPRRYCGMTINYNPRYDPNTAALA